jgi:predicted NAD/FAD-dependent oxidoreductase
MTIAPISVVDATRAPDGKSLFAVTVRESHFSDSTASVIQCFQHSMQRNKLINVGDKIACIADQTVTKAQFVQNPHHFSHQKPSISLKAGLYVCGEHLQTSSINGALESGAAIADEIVRTLSVRE